MENFDCKQDMLGVTKCSKQCDECRDTFINEIEELKQKLAIEVEKVEDVRFLKQEIKELQDTIHDLRQSKI